MDYNGEGEHWTFETDRIMQALNNSRTTSPASILPRNAKTHGLSQNSALPRC